MNIAQKYVGTKILKAMPLSLGGYNDLQGWAMPGDQDPNAPGYLVEYQDGGKPNHADFAGYISWSPKDVFEQSYKPFEPGISFGDAVRLMKQGMCVSRSGWNGKGMFLYLVGKGNYPPSTPAGHMIASERKDGLVPYRPYIAMKTVDGDVVPWVASQTDILANDWDTMIP